MKNNIITKELVLNFSIEQIKENIDKVVRAGAPRYSIKDKNDIFHTYRIIIVNGMLSGVFNITLKSIDNNTTEWKSEIISTVGGGAQPSTLSKWQDEFLSILSKGLSGEEISKELVDSNRGGCMGVVVFFVLIISIIAKLVNS